MPGRRHPWGTSLLALVLGPVGFGLMFMAESTDDYSGWPPVIAAAQLLWLWLVDVRGRDHDDDQARTRMSLAARITASISIGLAGGVISAASIVAVLEMAETAGVFIDWVSILAPVALAALPILPLVWGVRAWLESKRRAPRAAVQAMLGPLTVFTLPAVGLGWVAYHMTRNSQKLLGGMFSWFALIGALLVLAWTALPWLELYLSGRGSNRDTGAAPPTRAPEIRRNS